MLELTLTFSARTSLLDRSTLLVVSDSHHDRGWFRKIERFPTVTYVLKGGTWWGKDGSVPRGDPKHRKLCEIATQERAKRRAR